MAERGGAGGGREVLVILSGGGATGQLGAGYRVRQSASPRVLVVEASGEELAGLRALPGATVLTGGEAPHAVTQGLDEGEALFVAAWLSRIEQGPSKKRRGEGLSWDAPGFLPPDPPRDAPDPGGGGEEEKRRE